MNENVVIKSSDGKATLTIGGSEVVLSGQGYSATTHIFDLHGSQLARFFANMAEEWKGWKGKKEYGSLENEFTMTATSDSTGHARVKVCLQSHSLSWSIQSEITIDAGELEGIAQRISDMKRKE